MRVTRRVIAKLIIKGPSTRLEEKWLKRYYARRWKRDRREKDSHLLWQRVAAGDPEYLYDRHWYHPKLLLCDSLAGIVHKAILARADKLRMGEATP